MTDLAVHDWPLPYVDQLALRPREAVTVVVIHCTELPDLATAREYGERLLYAESGTGNSTNSFRSPASPTTRAATTRSRSASNWSTPGAIRTGSIRATNR